MTEKCRSHNRPSFQGLSIIEGKSTRKNTKFSGNRESILHLSHKEYVIEAKKKRERRRKSMDLLRNSATSIQIKAMIENAMGNALEGIMVDGTPEERLQEIMTRAKESGLSVEKIFGYFNNGDLSKTHVHKDKFLEGLEKLGDNLFVINDDELIELIKKIDLDSDDTISLAEFKAYCLYSISSVAWKAERKRLEENGEMKKITDQLKQPLKKKSNEKMFPCGEKVYRTTKFFWKTSTTLEVCLFYSEALDIVTIQLTNQTSGKHLRSLCVRKKECRIDQEALNEVVSTSMENSDLDEKIFRASKEWEFCGKYIIARLKLKQSLIIPANDASSSQAVIPYLCKLCGDTTDTIAIPKPLNLESPVKSTILANIDVGEFDNAVQSFERNSRSARTSRNSAQELSNLVAEALNEIENDISPSDRLEEAANKYLPNGTPKNG